MLAPKTSNNELKCDQKNNNDKKKNRVCDNQCTNQQTGKVNGVKLLLTNGPNISRRIGQDTCSDFKSRLRKEMMGSKGLLTEEKPGLASRLAMMRFGISSQKRPATLKEAAVAT